MSNHTSLSSGFFAWGFDTETELIRPGVLAPPMACLTHADASCNGILHANDAEAKALMSRKLSDPSVRIVGQNVAFDMGVVAEKWPDLVIPIFAAYDADRVTDTMLRMQLIDIAQGTYRGRHNADGTYTKYGYSLEDIARRILKVQLRKDGYRMRYGSFIDVPLEAWPARAEELQLEARGMLEAFHLTGRTEKSLNKEGKAFLKELEALVTDSPLRCIEYPIDDAIYTLKVHDVQETAPAAWLVDQFYQCRGAFALHLSSAHGLRTEGTAVRALKMKTEAKLVDVTARLQAVGFVRADGSRDTKKVAAHMLAVCAREDLPVRRTDKEGVCLDSDACEATEDALLVDYANYSGLQKTLDSDIPMLEAGTMQPVHTRYGLAESGRTTSSGPNIQNFAKSGGVRECFVPRPGNVFPQGDYPQLELFTLAQCCYTWLGYSTLGDMLKKGIDPHTSFAATLAGVSYEEGAKLAKTKGHFKDNLRQIAKVFNFGKPGGLGPAKLVTLANTDAYGNVKFDEDPEKAIVKAKEYGKVWLETFPEMKDYFARVNTLLKNKEKRATVTLPGTGFVRGGAPYCAACNTGFQGLGAACAKNALYLVARAQYAEPASVLYGTRTAWFVHDEIAIEAPEATAHECALELVRLMIVGANEFLPDVPYTAEKMADVPTIMRRWSKDAKQVWHNGRLIPWEAAA